MITVPKPLRAPPSLLKDVCDGCHPVFTPYYQRHIMSQPNLTEPEILDLNGMEWTDNGKDVEFIALPIFQIEQTINKLLSGAVADFDAERRALLLERLVTHTHIIKNGWAYSYVLLGYETTPFIIMRQIPTEWDEDGNVI